MNDIDLTTQPAEDRKGRNRRFLVWGAVAAVGALITAAAFVDSEWADIGPENGFQTGSHNLQLKGTGEGDTWSDYSNKDSALSVVLSGGKLIPGESTMSGEYQVKNDSTDYASTLKLTMSEKAGATTSQELRDALIFNIDVGDEAVVSDTATYDELAGDGVTLENLSKEEIRDVTVNVSVNGNLSVEGQQAHLQLKFDGAAVTATP